MAGWIITGSDWRDIDWATPAVLLPFVYAINERLDACRTIAGNTPQAFKISDYYDRGDDPQLLIYQMQTAIELLATAFWPYENSENGGGIPGNFAKKFNTNFAARTIASYGNQDFGAMWRDTWYNPSEISSSAASIYPETVSLADICQYLSNGRTGAVTFRRATTKPTDWTSWNDTAFSFGKIQRGDICGPWLLRDMQEILNQLTWVIGDAFYWAAYGYGVGNYYRGVGDSPVSYGVAQAYAQSDYQVAGVTDLPSALVVFSKPLNYHVEFAINSGGVEERYSRISERKRNVNFFVKTEKVGSVFWSNDTAAFVENKFALVKTFEHSGSGKVVIPASVNTAIVGQSNFEHTWGMRVTTHTVESLNMRCAAIIEDFGIEDGFIYY